MPNPIVGLGVAVFISCGATAAEWALGGVDYYSGFAGQSCYSDRTEYVVYSCECDWDVDPSGIYECPGDDACGSRCDMNGQNCTQVCYQLECVLAGYVAGNYKRFCWPEGGDACMACGCTGTSSWTTHSSSNHTVKRTVKTATSSGYTCTGSSTTEYGCAAGYYKSSGSGSSMVCAACPSGGTTSIGNTGGITSCCKSAGASFTDTKGTYTCSGRACYQS